jgi:hypothetical protein
VVRDDIDLAHMALNQFIGGSEKSFFLLLPTTSV